MAPDDAFQKLMESCSLYGLYRLLSALDRKGEMTASELARVTGLGSHAQTKKYLTLATSLVSVTTTRGPISDSPGSVLALKYAINENGRDILQFFNRADMTKPRLKEPMVKK